jgi:hypothetical protein
LEFSNETVIPMLAPFSQKHRYETTEASISTAIENKSENKSFTMTSYATYHAKMKSHAIPY